MAKTQKETDKSEELRGDVSYSEYIDSNSDILILKDKDGIKNRLFLKQVKNVKETYRIASSNWVNDFQEHIGVGKFMIIEVPQLNLEIEEIKDNLLNNDQKEFKIRIQRAISIIKDIDNDIRNAEWGNVVKGCRDAIEPFVKNLTPFIKDMLIKTTGIEERNATQLTMSLDNFFGYTSGLHHQINRSGTLATPFIGGKEDAYMSYMVTSSLINSLARKFIRSTLNR